MATVDGSIVDAISEEDGRAGEGTKGRFVTWDAAAVLLEQAVEGVLYLLRARDSGEPGLVYIHWTSFDQNSNPTDPFTGPLTDRVVLRLIPRRGALPVLMENGEVVLME